MLLTGAFRSSVIFSNYIFPNASSSHNILSNTKLKNFNEELLVSSLVAFGSKKV